MAKNPSEPNIPDDDDAKFGKDVPFKRSYQPDDDDLDSSDPPQRSGGPPVEEEKTDE